MIRRFEINCVTTDSRREFVDSVNKVRWVSVRKSDADPPFHRKKESSTWSTPKCTVHLNTNQLLSSRRQLLKCCLNAQTNSNSIKFNWFVWTATLLVELCKYLRISSAKYLNKISTKSLRFVKRFIGFDVETTWTNENQHALRRNPLADSDPISCYSPKFHSFDTLVPSNRSTCS